MIKHRIVDLQPQRRVRRFENEATVQAHMIIRVDAAHPIMPDQNQGFSRAIENAGALGQIFSKEHAKVIGQNVRPGLPL